MSAVHTPLAGGAVPRCSCTVVGRPDADARVDFLLTVRSRNLSRGLGWVNRVAWLPPAQRIVLSRAEYAAIHGAADVDLDKVRSCLAAWSIDCARADSARRLLWASGPAAAVERALDVPLELHADGADRQHTHLSRNGPIHLPPRLVGIVRAVTGLDGCARLKPFVHEAPAGEKSVTGSAIRSAWGLRRKLVGADVCVAVTVPADGVDAEQLAAAGLPADVDVLGGGGGSGRDGSADWAAATAAQVRAVQAIAPAARVVVHLGGGGERGTVETLSAAIHDAANAPQVVLAGWGAPEHEWSMQAMVDVEQRFLAAASMGVTVICASPVDAVVFPATAPHALACGPAPSSGSNRRADSALFPGPAWQESGFGTGEAADVTPRAVPDILGPKAIQLRGSAGSVGGAGVSAALCAGLVAALGQAAGAPVGLLPPLLVHPSNAGAEPVEVDVGALLQRFADVAPVPTATPPPSGARAHPGVITARR